MMNIAKVLVCVIVVALLSLIQNVTNAKKLRRARQALMPVIAFAFAVYAILVGFDKYPGIFEVTEKSVVLKNTSILFINLGIFISFIMIKLIVRPVLTGLWKKQELIQASSAMFYEYDEDYEQWFLKHQWVNFQRFFFAVVCAVTLTCGVYVGLTYVLGAESFVWSLAFPCAVLTVVNEIYGFINGHTKASFEHSVLGDEADARRVSNYYKIRKVLEDVLPDPMLSSHTGVEFARRQTPVDLMKELKQTGDTADRLTAEFFEIDDRYKKADVDCVQATAQIMRGKNVVFFNPFYRDLGLYITLPLVNALLAGKKCTVITGRKSNCEDVRQWLTDLLGKYSHMRSLWRVQLLTDSAPDCEVGVLSFPQLYDGKVLAENREFLQETSFVLLVEPSVILTTGQVALSIFAQEMSANEEKPVYCVCDRNTEGLVDTLSHLLRAEITNVVAPPVPRCIYTGMSWNANGDFIRQRLFDKQTRYLASGMELAAVAVKNQVPHVTWYGESKAPLRDIKWIAGQHYTSICRYMNIPAQQKSLYEKIEFVPTLWSAPVEKERFMIAEDEFCNMFSTMRAYLSRGSTQSFVNVLSENYLLRDYMRCNRQMFLSNPNAVPAIVPDYAKTERNTLLKLLILMTQRPVQDREILDEFRLVGIETIDAMDIMSTLLKKYTFADSSIFSVQSIRVEVDELTTETTCQYSISQDTFNENFASSLKNAYFILEDEKQEQGYIDAKLFSHVTQIILPGQFVTYDGKYYVAKHVDPQCGVVLRRASDLFDGRKYYRQIRRYHFGPASEDVLVSIRTVMDIEIAFVQKDFDVTTTGYLELRDNHDLRQARPVDFAEDPTVGRYARKYHHKSVLRVKLPDTDEKIRYTLCLLLSEAFRTIFPEGWPYLAVVTKRPEDIDGVLDYAIYSVDGEIEDDYIYFVEDSDLDLGLLEAVERNLMRLMELVTDFVEWHFEKMQETEQEDPPPVSVRCEKEREERQRQSLVQRFVQTIARMFGGKKMQEEDPEDEPKPEAPTETVPEGQAPAEAPKAEQTEMQEQAAQPELTEEPDSDDPAEEVQETEAAEETEGIQETDETAGTEGSAEETESEESAGTSVPETVSPEDEPEEQPEESPAEEPEEPAAEDTEVRTETRYQRECFLKFGFEKIDSRLRMEQLQEYLRARGWSDNALSKARRRDGLDPELSNLETVNHCDFCMLPLSGVSYEELNDGRIRCNDCSASAITTMEDFSDLFRQVLELMESFYAVKYRVPIRVAMADARTVAKGAGCIFRPTSGFAGRVLGFAQYKRGKYSLLIENGSPRLASIDTMVHEMTHIWQYLSWSQSQILGIYSMGKNSDTALARDVIYEGMAMWASIQYLYQIGETCFAQQQEILAEQRSDVYGIGFRLFREQYPLVKDASLIKRSPFAVFPPLEPSRVREVIEEIST